MMDSGMKAIVLRHRNWLSRTGGRVAERDRKYLLEDLSQTTVDSLRLVPDSLCTLAQYHGAKGIVDLIDGTSDGWEDIELSIEYHAWSAFVRLETFLRRSQLGISVVGVANDAPLAACVASVSSKWQRGMVSILARLRRDPEFPINASRVSQRFEEFAMYVDQLGAESRLDVDVEESRGEFSVYTQAIEAWNNSQELDEALVSICDYHLTRVEPQTEGEFRPEFKYAPFDLLPCEWMLVSRTRRHIGMEICRPSHPLISLLSAPDDIRGSRLPGEIEGGLIALRKTFLS